MIKLLTHEQKEVMYLDWRNNFLTLERFAEHWQVDEVLAWDIINEVKQKIHTK